MTTLKINYSNKDQAKKDFAAIKIEIKFDGATKTWSANASVDEIKAASAVRYADHSQSWVDAINQYLPTATTPVTAKTLQFDMYNAKGTYYG
jgi:hypothetical protein